MSLFGASLPWATTATQGAVVPIGITAHLGPIAAARQAIGFTLIEGQRSSRRDAIVLRPWPNAHVGQVGDPYLLVAAIDHLQSLYSGLCSDDQGRQGRQA